MYNKVLRLGKNQIENEINHKQFEKYRGETLVSYLF